MSDLISRKAVLELIESKLTDGHLQMGDDIPLIDAFELLDDVSDIPTAYDVDKVVSELKSHNNTEKMATTKLYNGEHRYYRAVSVTKAIKIVKGGGVDE